YSESDAQHPGQHARKNAHNAIERRYRSNINDRIAGLRDVVPALRETRPRNGRRKRRRGKTEDIELVDGVRAATKLSKATILTKATEYICYLKSREVQLSREVAGLHMLLRSFEGGDELLTQWSAEMERLHNQYPPIEAVYSGVETPPPT
ncbi:basic helix-loop-helix domain-containing protein, partial [Bacillus licheniformis]|nr:basic helix-loop-helix domain-containing protein [Bacillus licheniformis]